MDKKNLLIIVSILLVLAVSACTTYKYQPAGGTPTGQVVAPEDITGGKLDSLLENITSAPEENVNETEEVTQEPEGVNETEEVTEEPEENLTGEKNITEVPTETTELISGEKADIVAFEGDLVDLKPVAMKLVKDPDGDPITLGYTEPFDVNGVWQTGIGDAGFYSVIVTATDGKDLSFVPKQLKVNIIVRNKPPVISISDKLEFNEGALIELKPAVTDEDGDDVQVSYSGWMNSNSYQTTYDDAGVYIVKITASDKYSRVTKDVQITVKDVNRPPVVELTSDSAIVVTDGTLIITEGGLVQIAVNATDPESDELAVAFSSPLDEAGKWQTERGDAGEYPVTVNVSDGINEVVKNVKIKVLKANEPPVIESASVTPQEVVLKKPGDTETLIVNVAASDPDGDKLTYTYSGYMDSDTKTVTYGDKGGVKEVTVTVSDGTDEVSKDSDIQYE